MPRHTNHERNTMILSLYRGGLSLTEIEKQVNLSLTAVWKVIDTRSNETDWVEHKINRKKHKREIFERAREAINQNALSTAL